MQFPPTLDICKDVWGPQYDVVVGIGDFLAGMSVISFSLDRCSGEVGDTENVRLSQDILEGSFL